MYIILLFLLILFGGSWLIFGKPTDIVSQFLILLSSNSVFLGSLVKALLIIVPIATIILAIKFHKKSIIYIVFIFMLWIIYSPMQDYINNHIEEEKTSYDVSDYVEYEEKFDSNSKYYFENTPDMYNAYGGTINVARYYNEETLKNEDYPITYKFEIKNIINDKQKIKEFKDSLESIYSVDSVVKQTFSDTTDLYSLNMKATTDYIPFDDENYNIYLLTYLYKMDTKEGAKNIGFGDLNFNLGISCQDNEIVLPKDKQILMTNINYTALLNEEKSSTTSINETYVNYVIISVPNIYDDYNFTIQGKAFIGNDIIMNGFPVENTKIIDFKTLLVDFGL